MAEKLTISVAIRAAADKFRDDLKRASTAVKSLGTSGKKAGNDLATGMDQAKKGVQSISKQLEQARKALIGFFAVREIGRLAKDIFDVAAEAQGLTAAMKAVTGSSEAAAKELSFVRSEADRLGLPLAEATKQYLSLTAAAKGSALAGRDIRDIFSAISETAVVLNLSNEQLEGTLTAVQQMISKGTVAAEELRGQMGERLYGAFVQAAQAIGVTTQELGKMLERGMLPADRFLPVFAAHLRSQFGGAAEEASQTARRALNRFENALRDLKISVAEGGFLDAITASMNDLAGVLKDPEVIRGARDLGNAIAGMVSVLSANADKLDNAIGALAGFKAGTTIAGFIPHPLGKVAAIAGGTAIGAVVPDLFDEEQKAQQKAASLEQRAAAIRRQIASLEAGLARASDKERTRLEAFIKRQKAALKALEERIKADANQARNAPSDIGRQDPASQRIQRLRKELQQLSDQANNSGGTVRNAIEDAVKQLETEAATYGQTAEQIALYRLEIHGATEAQLARARAAIADIEAQRAFEAANQAAIEDAKRQAEEQKRLGEELDRQAQYWRDLINPVNQYQRQIEQLERLYNAGKISAETYAEATFRIQDAIDAVGAKADEAKGEMNQFAVQAARNIQDQLGSTLNNVANTSFQGILRSWVDMLRKMASEALAAQLAKKLLGDSFGKTGDLGGLIGALIAGIHHTGGIAGQPSQTRAVSPLLFAGAQRYHTGGFPGLAPSEVPAILQRGEEVLTRNDPRNALNGGDQAAKPQVRIVNVIDPAMVQDYMTSASGEDAILNVLSRRRSDVQAIVS